MIKLELDVSPSVSDLAMEDGPNKFVVELTPEQVSEIERQSKIVEREGAYEITTFNYDGEWLVVWEGEGPGEPVRMEAPLLCVSKASVTWSGYLKHTDIEYSTCTHPIADLVKA